MQSALHENRLSACPKMQPDHMVDIGVPGIVLASLLGIESGLKWVLLADLSRILDRSCEAA
jgi:hypothetical protein